MNPPAPYYARYPNMPNMPNMLPQQPAQPSAVQHHSPPPHYSHPHYSSVPPHSAAPQHTNAQPPQYLAYPPHTYAPQSPYVPVLSVPQSAARAPPSPSPQFHQVPSIQQVQQLHVLPSYITRPHAQPPMQTSIPIPQSYVMQVPAPKETPERDAFYAKLHAFRDEIGEPIQRLPTLGFKELDLCVLYKEVVKRNGIDSVIAKKQWKEVAEALQLPSSCTDSGFRLRLHYKKYLEAFERKFYTPPPRCEPSSKSKECKLPKDKDSTKKEAVEKSSSSVTSSASVVTDLAEENHSSGSSARSSAITASTAEATSKGLKPSSLSSRSVELRKSSAIVKKKKRSNPITSPKTIIRGDAKDSIKLTKAVNVVNTPNSTAEKENESTHTGQDTKVAAGPSVSQNMDSSSDKQSHQTKEQIAQPSAPSSISGEKKVESSQETQREKPAAAKTTLSASERAYGNLSVLEAAVNAVDLDRKIAKRKNRVDFSVLEDSTLKRYAKVYDVADNCKAKSKKELADQVSAHFSATPLDGGEQEALLRFIQAVRRV